MKKIIGILAIAGLVGGAVISLNRTTEAMPPPPLPAVQVECIGTAGNGSTGCCFGPGPREYTYRVVLPGIDVPQVTRIDIGTHWPVASDYTNLLMPAGWTMSILPAPYLSPDRLACTSHGGTTFIVGNCPYILRWTGPAQTATFKLGFDTARSFDAHDVNWKASTPNKANWTKPVGLGQGPVHCIAFP